MNGLQLVGYTADLAYLVFDDAGDGGQRHRVPVDDDLLTTLREVVAKLGAPPMDQPGPAAAAGPAGPATGADGAEAVRPLAALGLLAAAGAAVEGTSPIRVSRLSPRQIQALLRAGAAPREVARDAGVDEDRVLRWLPPIEAERARVLLAVRSARMVKPRLGPSRDVIGPAVATSLAAKPVPPEGVEWSVTRGEHDAHWSVSLRYRQRARWSTARWRFDPETSQVTALNDLAIDVAWTRPGALPAQPDPQPDPKLDAKPDPRPEEAAGEEPVAPVAQPSPRRAPSNAKGRATRSPAETAARGGARRSSARGAAVDSPTAAPDLSVPASPVSEDPGADDRVPDILSRTAARKRGARRPPRPSGDAGAGRP